MRLKEIRTEKGLSQKEVADAVGCSQVTYSRYESEEREPSLDTVMRLADFFGVSTDYLLGRIPDDSGTALSIAMKDADPRAVEDAMSILMAHRK